MIYWPDRLLWSMACLLAGLVGLNHAVEDFIAHGISSPTMWMHAIGVPAMTVGIIRAWMVR